MKRDKLIGQQKIDYMREKGIKFTIVAEEDALRYLSDNNNYFKLTAYRKNYEKNKEGKYICLEFAYLQDIAIIDMRIRKCLLSMCLDIEHSIRVRIVNMVEMSDEDGYGVVEDFRKETMSTVKNSYDSAKKSEYCKEIINKYEDDIPIWAFVEIQQFGCLCELLNFITLRNGDTNARNEYYMLQEIRHIRNACAHSNCVLNDLKPEAKIAHQAIYEVKQAMSSAGISKDARSAKMKNSRIRQIVTLLYYYSAYIKSEGLRKHAGEMLREEFIKRPSLHLDFYQSASQIKSFFELTEKLIDKWYPKAYNPSIEKKP